MNFISKLFSKAAPVQVEQNAVPNNSDNDMLTQLPQIDKSLFTEDRHPSEIFPIQDQGQGSAKKSILEDLKARNYFAMGRRDGHEDHNFETMDQNVNLIACDFKEVYARAIEEIDEHLFKIERILDPKFEKEMPLEYREVIKQQEQLLEQKRDLKQQFDLAVLGEGYIEKSVQQYKAGFKKGYKLWTEENLMFKPFNTLGSCY
ncbi:hypothetical protein [Algoriphagus sp.]|uniref:hypothetical protein n=1 Tax=Algoriphagus sp. TaxID=1872435 RepID=UPI003F6E5896